MKRLRLFLFFSCCLAVTAYGQEKIQEIREEPFEVQYSHPEFPEGKTGMVKFIKKNLKYPETYQEQGIDEIVRVSFWVQKDGSIRNVMITEGCNSYLKEETIRVIRSMPNWIPTKANAHPIALYCTLTINFKPNKEIEIDEDEIYFTPDRFDDYPYTTVEQMPQYPGGEAEMMKYISKNLKYPILDKEEAIQSRVTVRFIVEKDGTLSNFEVLRGIVPEYDEATVEMIKQMPTWIPGKQNGKAVRVYYTLPIMICFR